MSRERITCDVLVIGGGIAGLSAALHASRAGASVILLMKGRAGASATGQAQGGIAAAIDTEQGDSPALHYEDTLNAGAGLCDPAAVDVLVKEGVDRVRELIEMGANFDQADGRFSLTIEGAHGKRRILHARDTTGREIEKTLGRRILSEGRVKIHDFTFGRDLVIADGWCVGALAIELKTGRELIITSRATVLSTGGLGQVYSHTTNPSFATGDGVAMAYRAGAEIADMEFTQFHPTALVHVKELEDLVALPRFLISEAVRGEGGILLNHAMERFMVGLHPQGELAPRDIVARAIFQEMKEAGTDHVFLSLQEIPADKIKNRFPHIYETCLSRGLDITKDLIPVAPACHYAMGGIHTDLNARTSVPGLYAAGEVANTGVHGANRLASNSLLEGLVFGTRAGQQAAGATHFLSVPEPVSHEPVPPAGETPFENYLNMKHAIKQIMWDEAGIIRSGHGLTAAQQGLARIAESLTDVVTTYKQLEIHNMLTASRLIVESALTREESRGAHFRIDCPVTDPHWEGHVVTQKSWDKPKFIPTSGGVRS